MAEKKFIPTYERLEWLWSNDLGCHQEYFFHDNYDWSRVLVFFNGALNVNQRRNGYTFHRWTWAAQFRHPVIIIADPATYGADGLTLGWYAGTRSNHYLPSALDKVRDMVERRAPGAQLIAFGSSAGGFAALAGLQHGYFDLAFAINPQTDIELYRPAYAVRAFLDYYGEGGLYASGPEDRKRLSLLEMGFEGARPGARILYAQNTADADHYNNHMTPYLDSIKSAPTAPQLESYVFTDPKMGHNPPQLDGLIDVFGNEFESLLHIDSGPDDESPDFDLDDPDID